MLSNFRIMEGHVEGLASALCGPPDMRTTGSSSSSLCNSSSAPLARTGLKRSDLMNQILMTKRVISRQFGRSKKLSTELLTSLSPCKWMGNCLSGPNGITWLTQKLYYRSLATTSVLLQQSALFLGACFRQRKETRNCWWVSLKFCPTDKRPFRPCGICNLWCLDKVLGEH